MVGRQLKLKLLHCPLRNGQRNLNTDKWRHYLCYSQLISLIGRTTPQLRSDIRSPNGGDSKLAKLGRLERGRDSEISIDPSLVWVAAADRCHGSWHVTHIDAQGPREYLGGSTLLKVLRVLGKGAP